MCVWGLHHWKVRAEAVKNIFSVNSKTGEKVLFQNSIQKSMGIEKTTGFPLKAFSHAVWLNLSRGLSSLRIL